ncbi:MAG: hypothetical protein U5K29_10585 [Acidimicrobiales bacterium]|nr:hypothetical protein [Acidimicrobiales bacterium]
MAVKRCPNCGDLYLAAVDVCADCGIGLVEVDDADSGEVPAETAAPESTTTSSVTGDHAVWELDAWTMEGRRLLDGMLSSAEIPRGWQGASLVAPRTVRDQVDDMVAVVARGDARVGLDDETLAAADAGATIGETVGYEVSDWPADALDRLEELLARNQVPYGWDEDGDLVVAVDHEATVDSIFARLSDGVDGDDADEAADDEGPEALETLSEMFLAADTLARNPLDGNAARSLVAAKARADEHRLPFGFSPKVWEAILGQARALTEQIDSGGLDDDAVEDAAAELRSTLRDYV